MFRKMLLLFWLPLGWLQAQQVIVAGQFLYQSQVPFSLKYVSNQVTFEDEWGEINLKSDAQGYFKVKLPLDHAGLIYLTRHENLRLYLRPGDSLWVEMINRRNVKFGGTAAGANQLLHEFDNRALVPSDIEQNPLAYSAYTDSLSNHYRLALTKYEADQADPAFVRFFTAETGASFLSSKISLLKKLEREGLDGALKQKVQRQLQAPLQDEVRSSAYIYSLRELFQFELGQMMGQDIPADQPFGRVQYPPGYVELYAQHWRERLANTPQLYRFFELLEYAASIDNCSKPEQLPAAKMALEQVKKALDYPGFIASAEASYHRKYIQYHLRKLPELSWQDQAGNVVPLSSNGQQQLIVFWDALNPAHREVFQRFQGRHGIKIPGNAPDSVLFLAPIMRTVWVQVGGSTEQWLQTIAQLSKRYPVDHYQVRSAADLQALEPYLKPGKLPLSFALQSDWSISAIMEEPSVFESARMLNANGKPLWRPARE